MTLDRLEMCLYYVDSGRSGFDPDPEHVVRGLDYKGYYSKVMYRAFWRNK